MDAIAIDTIKKMYTDEWVFIGNPIMDKLELNPDYAIGLYSN